MRKLVSLLAFVSATAFAACAPKTEEAKTDTAMTMTADPAAMRQMMDSVNAKFGEAFAKGDTATISSFYADDAVVMMNGMPAWHGRADIAKGFGGMIAMISVNNAKFVTSDVMLAGDLAVESGTYEMTMQEKGKTPMTDKGKYVVVYKRQADGSWKIVRDIGNSDMGMKM